MILLSFIFSLLYWIVASAIDSFLVYNTNFLNEFFRPQLHTVWIRFLAIFFIMGVGIYLQAISTKRRKTNTELDQEYDLIPSALNKINSLVVVFDSLGRIIRFNQSCERMSGYSFEEVRGKYFWKIFLNDEDTVKAKSLLLELEKGEFSKHHENYWLTKDGGRRLIKWSNTTIVDKKKANTYVIGFGVDITAHKYAEEAIKRSEKEYKNIIDNISVGVSLISSDLRILYANTQMQKWFRDKDIFARSIPHNILSDSFPQKCSRCPSCQSFSDGQIHEAMIKNVSEGEVNTYKVVSFPIKNKEDKVLAVIETLEDFTNINRQAEEIRYGYLVQAEINSLLRFSLENISFDGFLKCALGAVLSNPSFSKLSMGAILLVEGARVLTLKTQSKIPKAILAKYNKLSFDKYICGRAVASASVQFSKGKNIEKANKEDSYHNYGHYCMPIIYSSTVLGVIDIYLEKDQEQNVKDDEFLIAVASTLAGAIQRKISEDKLSKINKCFVSLGIDPEDNIQRLVELCGDILEADSAFYNRLDLTRNYFESIGQYKAPDDYESKYRIDGSLCSEAIKKANQGVFIISDLPKTSYAKTDSHIIIYKIQTYVAQAVKCRGDYVGAVCAIYKDNPVFGKEDRKFIEIISSAVGLEEERIKANQELKQACLQLEEAQYGLVQSEKLAALGRFSSGIAHEVKNPLGIILGGIEFLENRLQESDDTTTTAIKKIKESTLRADGIVCNLLKFAMPSELKKEKVNPNAVVEETLSLIKYRISLVNISIETEFSKDNLSVEVDKNQIQQVLFNILLNAIEAMSKNGKIKVKTYKTTIEKDSKSMLFCVIEVVDAGKGISSQDLPKLFEPFFTTKRDNRGTGLGLSMSKLIVENHQGFLTIYSDGQKGTTAKILLPIV